MSDPKAEKDKPKSPCWVLLLLLGPMYLMHEALEPAARAIMEVPKGELRPAIPFALGVGVAILFAASKGMAGLQTIFHELRHAAVVVLTGNRFSRLEFYNGAEQKRTGAKAMCFYFLRQGWWGKFTHPLIAVAPYSFPLLTPPVLALVYLVPAHYYEAILFSVGLAAGIDVGVAVRHFFNANNHSRGDFSAFQLGFLVGTPFCLLANLVVIEVVSIWLYRFIFPT
jgi:hypothetical protein